MDLEALGLSLTRTVRFITADGRSLSILVPEAQAEVLRDIQELMPYGVAVRDVVKDRVERPSKLVS